MITRATPCSRTSSPSTSSTRRCRRAIGPAVELTLELAKALDAALAKAIAAAEIEEAERLHGLERTSLGAPAPAAVSLVAA